jgi:mTERF domain-containing protein, mitochondrial
MWGKRLGPCLVELTDLSLSHDEIMRIILVAQSIFRRSSLHPNLEFWISIFDSLESLLRVCKVNNSLLQGREE